MKNKAVPNVPPKLDLDELMERIRSELAKQSAFQKHDLSAPDMGNTSQGFERRNWTARELLTLPTAEFAHAVHFAFLGREPTPDEFTRLRDRLILQHVGRMRVLREFHDLPEGRQRRTHVDGFWRESLKDRIYWSPPAKLGRFAGRAIGDLSRTPQRIRAFVNRMESLERGWAELSMATATFKNVQANTTAELRRLQKDVAQFRNALEDLKRGVDGLEVVLDARVESLAARICQIEELTEPAPDSEQAGAPDASNPIAGSPG
ncbi:MAG TPA: hypothetical protein VMF67_04245 [Rhizomicrobium sp.]|nr:hypothetical protein [Rhizomicrobium sp.]